jgi:hypothetical protein
MNLMIFDGFVQVAGNPGSETSVTRIAQSVVIWTG